MITGWSFQQILKAYPNRVGSYYPFGLTMAGISDQAALRPENRYKFNAGSELQHREFSDGTGLEWYTTNYRMYDSQLGRFGQPDPLAESSEYESNYAFASDDPVLINDPFGLTDSIPTYNLRPVTITATRTNKPTNNIFLFTSGNNNSPADNTKIAPTIFDPVLQNATLMPGWVANMGLKQPPYPKWSVVRQFRTLKTEKFIRVSNSKAGNVRGGWLVKESSIRGMSPEQIQQNLALKEVPDQIGEVEVPKGTLMRAGPIGANDFGPGNPNITQYQLMEKIPNVSFSDPIPLSTPTVVTPAPTEIPIEPMNPIDPIELPEIFTP